jgi:hypothetical protein
MKWEAKRMHRNQAAIAALALMVIVASCSLNAFSEDASRSTILDVDSDLTLLPDGQEFKTWEQPLKFSKAYYVAQLHPSDDLEVLACLFPTVLISI